MEIGIRGVLAAIGWADAPVLRSAVQPPMERLGEGKGTVRRSIEQR
jgi:hypothetical protein